MPLIVRTLTTALAAAALLTPVASAQPADMHRSVGQAAANAHNKQALRSTEDSSRRDADAVIRHQGPWSTLPGAIEPTSSTRPKPLPNQPTRPVNAQPVVPAPASKATDGGDGVGWATIGLGIAGSLLALGGLAALTRRTQCVRATT